jgi:cation diffusion facilitator CzcD-associated flavoprotein CzcO
MCLPQSEGIAYLNSVRTNFPKYIPKGKLANFLESYAVNQELCVWLSSTITSTPIYDSSSARWTVEVQRGDQKVFLNPKHLVLATGSGSPRIPNWNGMDEFQGALYHSDFHKDAEQFRGKRVVVVGAVSLMSQSHTYAYTHETVREMLVVTYVKIL